MIIYQYDNISIYTGVSREIADSGGCPKGWTRKELPTIPTGKFAQFTGRVWIILDERPDPPAPAVELGILTTDKWSIPADGETFATVTFTAAETVYFMVDSESHEVEPVDQIASIEITADAPGGITVCAQDKQIIITAVEV